MFHVHTATAVQLAVAVVTTRFWQCVHTVDQLPPLVKAAAINMSTNLSARFISSILNNVAVHVH